MKIKAWQAEISVLIGMAAAVFCAGFCNFNNEYNALTDTVFRLHIPANSDSPRDQAVKLKVRDAVLEKTADIFRGKHSADEAAAAAKEDLELIRRTAEDTLREYGINETVKCEVTKMHFDTKVYDTITMPAGEYSALRITIGSGEGKNWWCVMFPPLCLPAVTDINDALNEYDGVFTAEELDMLNSPENYECRFYILDLLKKLKDRFSE